MAGVELEPRFQTGINFVQVAQQPAVGGSFDAAVQQRAHDPAAFCLALQVARFGLEPRPQAEAKRVRLRIFPAGWGLCSQEDGPVGAFLPAWDTGRESSGLSRVYGPACALRRAYSAFLRRGFPVAHLADLPMRWRRSMINK